MSDVEDKPAAEGSPAPAEVSSGDAPAVEAPKDASDKAEEAAPTDEAAPHANGSAESKVKTPKAKKETGTADRSKFTPSKATPKAEDDVGESYKPGDLVQVKIQGYPWWPAIVVTPEHFPAAALAARPAAKTRKDGTSAVSYPVQFLGFPEYYWSRPTDIKPLSQEEVKAWNESGKKASAKGLKPAFQEAQNPPTLEQLMEAKTALEQSAEEVEDDEAMPDEQEEEDDEEDEVELDDEGKPVKKSKSKKKAAARTPKKTPSKTPTKKRKTDEDDSESAPSAKKSRATPKSAKAKQKAPSPPASPELTPEQRAEKNFESIRKSVMIVRSRIQKCLLSEKCDESLLPDIPGCLDKLDKIEPEARLFKETKIGKVLARMKKLESIPRDAELGIKKHVDALLGNEKWQEAIRGAKKLEEDDASAKGGASTPAPAAANKTETTNGHAATAATAKTTNGEGDDK